MLKRFEREAQATAALSSPHTIQLFDFGSTDDGIFYYVMELLMGRDLESLVREFGPVPAARAGYPAAAGLPLAGRRACARTGSSRHQARQHLRVPDGARVRLREGAGFRSREVEQPGVRRAHPDADDGRSADDGHAGLHGAGDHPRRNERRSASRRVCARLRRVLPADRPARLRGRYADEDAAAARAGGADPAVAANRAADSTGDRRAGARLPPEGPEQRPQNAEVLLDMACGCKTGDCWNSDLAKAWWEKHLPEFTGALTLGDLAAEPGHGTLCCNRAPSRSQIRAPRLPYR